MKLKFTHAQAMQYTNPSFVAVPGEVYELDEAPDQLNWEPLATEEDSAPAKKGK